MPLSSRGVKRVTGILQKMDEFGFTTAGRKLQRLFSSPWVDLLPCGRDFSRNCRTFRPNPFLAGPSEILLTKCCVEMGLDPLSSELPRRRPAMSKPERHVLRVARPCVGTNMPGASSQKTRNHLACCPLQGSRHLSVCHPPPRK